MGNNEQDELSKLLKSDTFQPSKDSLDALSQSNAYLKALIQFVTSVIHFNRLDDVLWHLTDDIIGELGFEDCVVYLLDEQSGHLMQRAAYGNKNPQEKQILNPMYLKVGEGIVGQCAEQQTPIKVDDTQLDKRYVVDDLARRSELAVPIICDGQTIGVIDSEHSQPNFYSQHHLDTLVALASVISTKYSNSKAIGELEHTISELEQVKSLQLAVFNIAELVFTTESLDQFYRELHKVLFRLVEAESFFICLYNEAHECLNFPYCYDAEMGGVFDFKITKEQFENSLTAQVILTEKPARFSEQEILELVQKKRVIVKGVIPKSWLGVPFETAEGNRGAVAIQNMNSHRSFDKREQDLLTYVSHQISIAIKRKSDEAMLHHLALHDELSGLPNRTLFIDRLSHALSRDQRNGRYGSAVMFLDLDRFKLVNDSYGHHTGDELIKQVSQRILSCLRKSDTLARLGGDEFGILIEDISESQYLEELAKRILMVVSQPVHTEDARIMTSASIGIVQSNERTLEPSEMVKMADNAMYQAKSRGKSCYVFADSDLQSQALDILSIEREIDNALLNNEFVLYLQPVVELKNKEIVGFETLIRWQHPEKGLIFPDYFLEIAQKSGQIAKIDQYILEVSAALLQRWQNEFSLSYYINVNISGSFLPTELFYQSVSKVMEQFKLNENSLNIEITEQALIHNLSHAHNILKRVKQLGLKIILDDFGTGYSSLSYLHQLPIDVVKIDRSFVMSLDESDTTQSVVKAIISLSHSLNMQVVAEGIEHDTQCTILNQLNACFGQGYLFSKPLPVSEIESKLLSLDKT
ncbi:bifunctional diguanylate cyclase/phosphodiesterase [Pleionea sediminis]|uniref:bifunctional diguanylate cyclase/phosphodiesterase n=1 Tax=Pleionea sediminis TaxID=2569479 RepID=UPI001184C620|nr:EAL domain-containing protein [Pleionea sediminis]